MNSDRNPGSDKHELARFSADSAKGENVSARGQSSLITTYENLRRHLTTLEQEISRLDQELLRLEKQLPDEYLPRQDLPGQP